MGKKRPPQEETASTRGRVGADVSLQDFAEAVKRQLGNKRRLVRTFDVGGTGVKTGLFAAGSLQQLLLRPGSGALGDLPSLLTGEDPAELQWIEAPSQLGQAPGEDGFPSWLLRVLPRLQREVENPDVVFGVSTAGDLEHSTGILHDWWSGGGHPRKWDDPGKSPRIAELMGLPGNRTFAIHDGAAHLLGCCRQVVPLPRLACFAVGTGVGFGLTDEAGALVDPSSSQGEASHFLNGVPLSGARYNGLWQRWVEGKDDNDDVERVLAREFAGTHRPFSTPWVSLVLGRRGIELAEAAFGCAPPEDLCLSNDGEG
ncbi:unnamed protein product, partial [Polarella glacialis]